MAAGAAIVGREPHLPLSFADGDQLGCSAAVAGAFGYVGVCGHTPSSGRTHTGAVVRFRLAQSASADDTVVVMAPDGSADARFGSALATTSHYLLVGAEGQAGSTSLWHGAAYVFTHVAVDGPPRFTHKLSALDGRPHAHFGCAVAIHADRAVVGARGPDAYPAGTITPQSNGAAYVFDLATGVQLAKLAPLADTVARVPKLYCFHFGAAVAIDATTIIVGAPRAKAPCTRAGAGSGAAFAFANASPSTEFNQTARVLPDDAQREAAFGASVGIVTAANGRGTLLLLGAPGANADRGALCTPSKAHTAHIRPRAHMHSYSNRGHAPRKLELCCYPSRPASLCAPTAQLHAMPRHTARSLSTEPAIPLVSRPLRC